MKRTAVWKQLMNVTITAIYRHDQSTLNRPRASSRAQAKKSHPSQIRGVHSPFWRVSVSLGFSKTAVVISYSSARDGWPRPCFAILRKVRPATSLDWMGRIKSAEPFPTMGVPGQTGAAHPRRGVEQWQLARLITWRSQVQILSPQFLLHDTTGRGTIQSLAACWFTWTPRDEVSRTYRY